MLAHDSRIYYAQTRLHHGSTHRHASDLQDSFVRMKCILTAQLTQGQTASMPPGFPLHYTPDGHGSACLSEGSYEFRDSLVQSAIISFSDPYSPHRSGRDRGKYIWRISLPTFESNTHPDARVVSAEVQVDMAVMRSAYGDRIRHDARIISKALACSLEHGIKVNIALADYTSIAALVTQTKKGCIVAPGDVVYLSSDSIGQQQLLNILDRAGFYAKFTASPKFLVP